MLTKPQLSLCLDDLKLETKPAMNRARRMGFHAIDVGAVAGPISPQELSATGRRHLQKHLADLGLRMGSLRGPTGGASITDSVAGERRLEATARIIELAAGLHVPVVSTAIGSVSSADPTQASTLREMLLLLADRADRAGVMLAVETGGIASADLGRIVREINCPHLAACCDSGAMLMRGDDPHRIADHLAGRVQLVRARDAIHGTPEQPGGETSMGQGELDPSRFLAGLDEAGFRGDIVLTRSGSGQPAEELMQARELFERYLIG